MKSTKLLVLILTSTIMFSNFVEPLAVPCDDSFTSKCVCGNIEYEGKVQYVVNCTNTNFQNASVLQNLPSKTQVLVFTGNNIEELPMNVFGTLNTFTDLKVVDMSGNGIKYIAGKSYHRVANVMRLILNNNELSISSKDAIHHHPRLFSSFVNLLELHLTNAFADNTPEDLAADLHDIFVNSELQELRKLHLEQNEISQFKDPKVFCDLPNLQDLHIGQNKLRGLHFEIDCLPHLRFLDLELNRVRMLDKEDLATLDRFTNTHNQSFTIDLTENPLSGNCDTFYTWMQNTKVKVRNSEKLHCREALDCPVLRAPLPAISTSHTATEVFLFLALCASLALLIYTNRHPLHTQVRPLLTVLSRKVHYTTIGKQEDQEMNV